MQTLFEEGIVKIKDLGIRKTGNIFAGI